MLGLFAAAAWQVVNGPEVLSKYVGQAEENIRNLFGEAEAEYKEKGDASVSHQQQDGGQGVLGIQHQVLSGTAGKRTVGAPYGGGCGAHAAAGWCTGVLRALPKAVFPP